MMVNTTSNRTSALIDWLIMAALFTLFLAAAFTSRWQHSLSSEIDWSLWWDGFLQNSGTEMLGAFLTFGLIEILRGRRKESEAEDAEEARKQEIKEHVDQALVRYQETLDEQERQALNNQLSSAVPGLPAEAVRLLRHKGWLEDKDIAEGLQAGGDFQLADLRKVVLDHEILIAPKLSQANLHHANLEGANLHRANLDGANLEGANLDGANLEGANLDGANLWDANLDGANLRDANLDGANLRDANLDGANLVDANLDGANLVDANLDGTFLCDANLDGADLRGANLDGADLRGANLDGANLREANLEGAKRVTCDQLQQAKSLEGATLPDGTELPKRASYQDLEPDWRTPFEEWCKTVPVDKNGWIIVDD